MGGTEISKKDAVKKNNAIRVVSHKNGEKNPADFWYESLSNLDSETD